MEFEKSRDRVILILCDGSSGRTATSVLGLSDEFYYQSCSAYGATATLDRTGSAHTDKPRLLQPETPPTATGSAHSCLNTSVTSRPLQSQNSDSTPSTGRKFVGGSIITGSAHSAQTASNGPRLTPPRCDAPEIHAHDVPVEFMMPNALESVFVLFNPPPPELPCRLRGLRARASIGECPGFQDRGGVCRGGGGFHLKIFGGDPLLRHMSLVVSRADSATKTVRALKVNVIHSVSGFTRHWILYIEGMKTMKLEKFPGVVTCGEFFLVKGTRMEMQLCCL